jgi:hypothetical protein
MEQNYKRVRDIYSAMNTRAEQGNLSGLSTGSKNLDKILSVKKGYPWFIGGQPGHGKSEVTMELLVSWSLRYGWKHCCYFGEGGDIVDVAMDLCSKYIGKPYLKTIPGHMDSVDREMAHAFVDEHFDFLDLDNIETTYPDFLKSVEQREKETGIKFDTVTFDPWNDVVYELAKHNGQVSYWLKDVLRLCRIASQKNNRIDILVNHVAETGYAIEPDSKLRYRPMALADEWEGGKLWPRRAFVMLNVWRPPVFLKDDNGIPFPENTTILTVQKVKPKGVGSLGQARWEWNFKRNRFEETISTDQWGQNVREILHKDSYNGDDPKEIDVEQLKAQLPLIEPESEETPF